MNTPSPLIPQGTTPARGKTSFFVKVLMILALHVVVIGGMLLQGCRDTKDNSNTSSNSSDNTTASSDTLPPVTPAGVSNAATSASPATPGPGPVVTPATGPATPSPATPGPGPVVSQQPPTAPMQPPPVAPVAPPVVQPVAPPVASGEAKEYVIVSGDTLGAIAHRNSISLKALMEANPGVNPRKLQVGQKIQIPAGTATAAAPTAPSGVAPDVMASGDSSVYTVKSGDTLSKIAKMNHTSYKKIMALNDLKTTSIKIGQKLKLPAPRTAEAAPAVVPLAPAAPATTTAAVVAPSTTASN